MNIILMLLELGVVSLLAEFLIITFAYAVTVKLLERGLTFAQSVLISAVGVVIGYILVVAYYVVKDPYDLNRHLDKIAMLLVWFMVGVVITRLARNYGVGKHGWFGVGGKANLWLLMVLGAVFFAAQYILYRQLFLML